MKTHSLPAVVALLAIMLSARTAHAQAQRTSIPAVPAKKYAPVCARGVKVYNDIKQVPAPHDTLQIPEPDGPIRVTNEAEAEAAELMLRGRAGSVGATGVVVTDVETDDGNGRVTMRRQVTGVYAAADSAASQKACAK